MQNFNYHSHTYRCKHADFNFSDEDYVKEYIKKGFKKIAFTDHCPEKRPIDQRTNMRMEYSQKDEYLESINKLKEKYVGQIEIESGYEVEYLPGEEENIQELKDEVDKIILGQHFIYDENKNLKILGRDTFSKNDLMEYASYIEKAIELKIPNIVAHPDIYMLNRERFGEDEAEVARRICKVAEENNIPLEINLAIIAKIYYKNKIVNNDSIEKVKEKLKNAEYPCKEFWNIASNYNIRVLYGIDTHFKYQIILYDKIVPLINEIIGDDIISKLHFIGNDEVI